jgi:hypothetical protein
VYLRVVGQLVKDGGVLAFALDLFGEVIDIIQEHYLIDLLLDGIGHLLLDEVVRAEEHLDSECLDLFQHLLAQELLEVPH